MNGSSDNSAQTGVTSTEQPRRGRLTVFFGYADSSGKASAMLTAGYEAKQRGTDVVVGYINDENPSAQTTLLSEFEQLAPLQLEKNGERVYEFDLDAAIARRPQTVLIDGLAHQNEACCRHMKRYQDVEELLENGIDVYTTLNVQNIESLADTVAAVTGTRSEEYIPDAIFDNADCVKLVDTQINDLINRLEIKENSANRQSSGLADSDRKNYIVLREIALRRYATRFIYLNERKNLSARAGTAEHVLVCLSPSPANENIIRAASRMAKAFDGKFTALYVETPDFSALSNENRIILRKNISLARQLGAVVETTTGEDVATLVSEFARLSGVTKVVIGQRNALRKRLFAQPALSEQLALLAPSVEIYIIPNDITPRYGRVAPKLEVREIIYDLLKCLFILSLSTLLARLIYHFGYNRDSIIAIYIISTLFAAMLTKYRSMGVVLTVACILVFNFFFIGPGDGLMGGKYHLTYVLMLIAAAAICWFAHKTNQSATQAAKAAYRTKILLDTNQLMQKEKDADGVIRVTAQQLIRLLSKDILFYPVENGKLGLPRYFSVNGTGDGKEYMSEKERKAAEWVYINKKPAGALTLNFENLKCMYFAMRVGETVYGIVGVPLNKKPLESFADSIVRSILSEGALALEALRLAAEREQAALLAKNEQLRANLLRSISHDLRTPLTGISGAAGILLTSEDTLGTQKRKQLYSDIYENSMWLINVFENLLSVTRIEDGTMKLNITAELVDEVICEALRHINNNPEHIISVKNDDELMLANMDARLIIQVIINIVDNAVKYTPPASRIVISASRHGDFAAVEIADEGGGMSDEDKKRVFNMFYTVNKTVTDSRRSLGLGLALCKSIITAHGGEISVRDNCPHGGCVFRFTLPIKELELNEQTVNTRS